MGRLEELFRGAKPYKEERKQLGKADPVPEFFVYELAPIDWWAGSVSVAEYLFFGTTIETGQEDVPLVDEALRYIVRALYAITQKSGWEGDATALRIGAVPRGDQNLHILVLVKQANNGSTFLASPVVLPHLASYETTRYR